MNQLRFLTIGDWREGRVHSRWVTPGRTDRPEINDVIDHAWRHEKSRLGERLFDGPMCRLERWDADERGLTLAISRTSYRIFVGTNLLNPGLAERFGENVLANPVGVSALLITGDRSLILGRRNDRVAYYPNRIHPFAGALEPADVDDGDVFTCVRRELEEELSLPASEITDARCVAIVRDLALRQPELVFFVHTARPRAEIESSVHDEEHGDTLALPADDPAALSRELSAEPRLTPVAAASLLLWGRAQFGREWFEQHAAPFLPA